MRQHAVSTVRGLAAAGYCLKAEALRLAAEAEALRLAAVVAAAAGAEAKQPPFLFYFFLRAV